MLEKQTTKRESTNPSVQFLTFGVCSPVPPVKLLIQDGCCQVVNTFGPDLTRAGGPKPSNPKPFRPVFHKGFDKELRDVIWVLAKTTVSKMSLVCYRHRVAQLCLDGEANICWDSQHAKISLLLKVSRAQARETRQTKQRKTET